MPATKSLRPPNDPHPEDVLRRTQALSSPPKISGCHMNNAWPLPPRAGFALVTAGMSLPPHSSNASSKLRSPSLQASRPHLAWPGWRYQAAQVTLPAGTQALSGLAWMEVPCSCLAWLAAFSELMRWRSVLEQAGETCTNPGPSVHSPLGGSSTVHGGRRHMRQLSPTRASGQPAARTGRCPTNHDQSMDLASSLTGAVLEEKLACLLQINPSVH